MISFLLWDFICLIAVKSVILEIHFVFHVAKKHRSCNLCCRSGLHYSTLCVSGITYPSGKTQESLLKRVYSQADVSPEEVEYFEAHGTGTKVGDPEETNGIHRVLCQNRSRDNPLLIGSVKSNMGHSEASSGLAALVKVLMTFNNGVIPPNLHYETPNPDIVGLQDGTMKVVVEPTKFNGGYVGLSSFGFGGSNVHFILRPFTSALKPSTTPSIPKLLLCAGRTEDGVAENLEYLASRIKDGGAHSLTSHVANGPIQGLPYRGYKVINGTSSASEVKKFGSGEWRPIW